MAHVSKDQKGKVIIRDDWHIEDIRSMLEDEQELTDDECIDIMEIIADNFDANIGINWEVIGYHVQNYVDDRALLQEEQENENN